LTKRAIAKALKTKAATPLSGGAASTVQPNALTSYGAFAAGSGSYGNSLPRDASIFTNGSFGPLNPIQPVGIDVPDPESGRSAPRRMQYPVGWNMPVGQPGTEGLKLVSFANLRMYADAYSVVRACIQVRKEEILGLDWDIVPTDEAQREMRLDAAAHQDFQERRAKALDFFKRPDPNYHDFTGWLGAVLEDVFVVDALSIYLHPSRVEGKGLLGSNLAALEVLDGTTIRPLLDIRGGTPRPPSPAYQQYLWGVPRTDLMDIILQADIEEMDEPVAEYKADQLLYLPYTRRSWTPYGFPGIERAIVPVITGLKRQQFQLDYFSEGTIPGQFVIPGEDISTPAQIRQLQDTLNAIAGDQAWKHKIIVLPRGSNTKPQKPLDLASQFDEQLITTICMAYDVMPMELGVNPSSAGGQTPQATNQMAQASAEISKRKALKPMLQWLKSAIFDHILQDICGQDDMQWSWIGLESTEDEAAMMENIKTATSAGLMSIDEGRNRMGLPPWGLPLTSDPVYMSATGISTLGTVDPSVADGYFGQQPIVTDTSSQPVGTPVGSATPPSGAPVPPSSPQPAASAGLPSSGGRPRGGGGGAPAVIAPSAGTSTPLHQGNVAAANAKKALERAAASEFDALRRQLKKGRDITAWQNKYVSNDALAAVTKTFSQTRDITKAITAGKNVMKSADRLARRQNAMQNAATTVVSTLGTLAAGIHHPQVGPIKFIDNGVDTLAAGYEQVMSDAANHAASDYSNVSPVVPGGFKQIARDRAEQQRNFLTGLAQDVVSGQSNAKLNQRLSLYAQSLRPAYEQAYGLSVLTGQAIGNEAPVDDPDYADLSSYDTGDDTSDDTGDDTSDGSSGVAALVALAGVAAASYIIDGVQDTDGTMVGDDQPTTFDESPRSVIIWHATSDEPCALCDERDGEEYTLETLPCWPGDGGFDEFCEGAGNCNCYLEYTDATSDDSSEGDNPFKDFLGGQDGASGFYAQRSAEEDAMDQAATDARAADIASVAQESPDAAARMTANDMLNGVPGTRSGPGGKFSSVEADLHKAGNADALAEWYESGADGQINWGEPGDFDACVAIAGKHLENPEGYCQLRHIAATGASAGNASGEKVFKVLDPTVFKSLVVGDVITNEEEEDVELVRPEEICVAVIKGATDGVIPAGAQLRVMKITPNDIEFEIL
jgi:Phage portal protein